MAENVTLGIYDVKSFVDDLISKSSKGFTNQTTLKKLAIPPEGIVLVKNGEPANGRLARGNLTGSLVTLTNNNTQHSCDFKFLIDFGNINIGIIDNPVTVIQEAIKEGKNKAAQIIKTLLSQFMDGVRLTLTALNVALSFDPSGLYATAFDAARNIVRKINKLTKKIAEYVANAAMYVYLVLELKQIVTWIQQLPNYIKGLLKDCLTNFNNNIQSVTSQITSVVTALNASIASATSGFTSTQSPDFSNATSATDLNTILSSLTTLGDSTNTAISDIIVSANTPGANLISSTVISEILYTTTPDTDTLRIFLEREFANSASNFQDSNSTADSTPP
jgi:hypothetical protein